MLALEATLHEEAMGWFKDCSTGLIRIFVLKPYWELDGGSHSTLEELEAEDLQPSLMTSELFEVASPEDAQQE